MGAKEEAAGEGREDVTQAHFREAGVFLEGSWVGGWVGGWVGKASGEEKGMSRGREEAGRLGGWVEKGKERTELTEMLTLNSWCFL